MYRHMSFVARKPVFGICDKVRLKPACSATETWSWNSGYNKYGYYTIQAANNKGADQTARMRRLICAFVVRIWQKQVFSWGGSYLVQTYCKNPKISDNRNMAVIILKFEQFGFTIE